MAAATSIRDKVRAANDSRHEDVEVAEWGVTLRVFSMSGRARSEAMDKYIRDDGRLDTNALYPALLVACCYDPVSGEKAFLPEDTEWLADKAAANLENVAQVALRLSGMAPEAQKEAGKDS